VVLWLIVLITVIGSSHARNTRIETTLAFNHTGAAAARALAEAGINRAILELFVRDTGTRWPLNGSVHPLQLDSGRVNIAIRDASGLLDLNNAGSIQLLALLQAAGLEEDASLRLSDAILDWRDKDKLGACTAQKTATTGRPALAGAHATDNLPALRSCVTYSV